MKKFIIIMVIALVAAGAYFGPCNATTSELSGLQLANIEALTNNEVSNYEYPDGFPYMTTCNVETGESSSGVFAHVKLC